MEEQTAIDHARADLGNSIPGRIESAPKEGTLREMLGDVKEWWNDLRIGDGHLAAMGRLGAHELTQALAAFPDSNVRPMEEPGVFGNPTPQIVTQEMTGSYEDRLNSYIAQNPQQEPSQGMER